MRTDPARRAALALLCVGALALAGCESVPLSDVGPALSDDEPLSRAVRAALDAAPETLNQPIDVRTLDAGVVRLSGNVGTDAVRVRAAQIAEGVAGVERVVNTLFVRD